MGGELIASTLTLRNRFVVSPIVNRVTCSTGHVASDRLSRSMSTSSFGEGKGDPCVKPHHCSAEDTSERPTWAEHEQPLCCRTRQGELLRVPCTRLHSGHQDGDVPGTTRPHRVTYVTQIRRPPGRTWPGQTYLKPRSWEMVLT